MSGDRRDVPDFIRDAEEADEELDVAPLGRLPELLEGAAPGGLGRLLSDVQELPLRYAPFFERLALLWDIPEANVIAVLERSKDPLAWRKTPLPGLKVIDVEGGPGTAGAESKLVRFKPGFHFPRHRHPGHEAIFVLEGSYTDSTGHVVRPGDLHEMQPGTEHSFRVAKDEPCIAASVQAGREFTGPIMKILSKLFSDR
jgi:quercetin dioxygenase-like cupin family protein